MNIQALQDEKVAASKALGQHKAGQRVENDWYRLALKNHDKGEHKGMKLNLCPACQAE